MYEYCAKEQESSFREIPVEFGVLCFAMHQSLFSQETTD